MNYKYLAGLIDGEGSIMLRGRTHSSIELVIDNTYHLLIDKLQKNFGGSIRSYRDRKPTKNGGLRKLTYKWAVYGENAAQILTACYPYLIVKKKQAEIALLSRKILRDKSNHSRPLSSEELEERKVLSRKIKELNRP